MTTRLQKLRQFHAERLVPARLVRREDPPLRHLKLDEYASHVLCGPLSAPLDASEAKTLTPCADCESKALWRAARSA